MKNIYLLTLLSVICISSVGYAQTTTLSGGNTYTSNLSPTVQSSGPTVCNPVGSFSIVQTGASANLTQVSFTTTGTYSSSTDITTFTLYVNTNVNSIIGSSAVTSGSVAATGAGTQTINLSTAYSLSTGVTQYYFFIVPTVSAGAVAGHTIATNSIAATNIHVSVGSVSGSAAASGTLTIITTPGISGSTGASRCGAGH